MIPLPLSDLIIKYWIAHPVEIQNTSIEVWIARKKNEKKLEKKRLFSFFEEMEVKEKRPGEGWTSKEPPVARREGGT